MPDLWTLSGKHLREGSACCIDIRDARLNDRPILESSTQVTRNLYLKSREVNLKRRYEKVMRRSWNLSERICETHEDFPRGRHIYMVLLLVDSLK